MKFGSQLPTIWANHKQRWEESKRKVRRESLRREDQKKEDQRRKSQKKADQRRENQKKEDAGAQKGGKVAKHSVFLLICVSGGLKSRFATAAAAESAGQR